MILLVFLLLNISIHSNEVRILTSSSLNGNLDACTCKAIPISGLLKRGSFIESYKKKYPNVILLDTGNFFEPNTDLKTAYAIIDTYKNLGYNAVTIGKIDLKFGLDEFFHIFDNVNLVTSNLKYKSGFFSSEKYLGVPEIILNENIIIYGISNHFEITKSNKEISISSPFQINFSKNKVPIILSNLGENEDLKLISKLETGAIIIGGNDSTIYKPYPGKEIKPNVWYFRTGTDGNYLGEIIIDITESNFKVISQKLIEIDIDNTPDYAYVRSKLEEIKGKK